MSLPGIAKSNSRPLAAGPHPAAREARLFFLSLGINAVLLAFVCLFLAPSYETNDDVGMASIVSGVSTGTPCEDIIFSNVLIGRA